MNDDDLFEKAMMALIAALIIWGFWFMALVTYTSLKNEGASVHKIQLSIPPAPKKK